MNTLTLIKKQIQKQQHCVHSAMTSYRGVKFELNKVMLMKCMAPSAIVVTPIRSDRHGNTNSCWTYVLRLAAFIGMIYGELILLQRCEEGVK